ncbi:hypothetical protein BH11VER1_BH11VER1_21300 [soil metagenome]
MSANNDPIEVTVDKRGNVIILIDRHNMSAAEVLDMAARAMLAAGYDKSEILQAALAYGGKYGASQSTAAPPKNIEKLEPVTEVTPLPEPAAISSEVVASKPVESKDLPAIPAPVKEAIKAIEEATKPEASPAIAEITVEKTEVPAAPQSLPAPPVVEEKPEPVAVVTEIIPLTAEHEIEPVTLSPVATVDEKPEPLAADTAVSPPPFEVPPLAKAPGIPLRVQATPVSVMANASPISESPAATEKPSQSKMDEILAADRKRIQGLIAANTNIETKAASEPVVAQLEHIPAGPAIPEWAVPLTPNAEVVPVPVVITPVAAEPITQIAAAQEDWQGQHFDPATSTSRLIPPMPGIPDDNTPEYASVAADAPMAPPPLPKKPVSVVTPAMMSRPITAEVAPTPPSNIPPPPKGPVSLMSRITGFVKLNTIAIPHYPSDTPESTIVTPKPMTPSVLSPQPPPAAAAKR